MLEDPGRMLTAEDVVASGGRFSSATARGATSWSPADFRLLSIPLAAELADGVGDGAGVATRQIGDGDITAVVGEGGGDRGTDAAGTASNQGNT
jgi:hypothetical protein